MNEDLDSWLPFNNELKSLANALAKDGIKYELKMPLKASGGGLTSDHLDTVLTIRFPKTTNPKTEY